MAIALAGQPNVGKSSVLARITGTNVIISNYPGTSLELMCGKLNLAGSRAELIDTPGVYSLMLAQGEEVITRETVTGAGIELIINVVDAANLSRNLVLTLELLELQKPVIVLLNQIDRVRADGMTINHRELARVLGCPVFPFSAITSEGLMEVLDYLQTGLTRGFSAPQSPRETMQMVIGKACTGRCSQCLKDQNKNCSNEVAWARYDCARTLAQWVVNSRSEKQVRWLSRVESFIDNPLGGTLVLLLLMFIGFKGLVSFTGWAEAALESLFVPVQNLLSLGISLIIPPGFWNQVLSKGIPEGLLVPFALVMPAMFLVSILMSLLEDTGLLARYAVVLERIGGVFGVSGQAFIPLALGFGCRTPAVVATRILPGAAQRFIIITLLSIVIPCAATLGMITSVIAAFQANLIVVVIAMTAVFLTLGLGLKVLHGEKSEFVYELPPLRIPIVSNILSKIKIRFSGFITEVLPLLMLMSVGVRLIIDSGVLERLSEIEFITQSLFGIPAEAFAAVLVTVVQKYLAPLVLLNLSLSPREATIAISMVALSLPCLPVMVMTWRELGGKALAQIVGMGFAVSFAVGIILNLALPG